MCSEHLFPSKGSRSQGSAMPQKTTRRDILKGAPVALGYVAVSTSASADDAPPPPRTDIDPHRDVQIADTDHVRAYYRAARG